jgi:hypothetical protein
MSSDNKVTSWSKLLLEKLKLAQLVKKPVFNRTWRFITMFIRARQWMLSWVRWIQLTPFAVFSLDPLQYYSAYAQVTQVVSSLHTHTHTPHVWCVIRATPYFILNLIALILHRKVQIIKFLIIQYFLQPPATSSLWSSWSPQQPVLKQSQIMVNVGCDTNISEVHITAIFWVENVGYTVFWNAGNHLHDHVASQPRRPQKTFSPLWKPQIAPSNYVLNLGLD